jgi:hypothetical protein
MKQQIYYEWIIALLSLSAAANLLVACITGIERSECLVTSIVKKPTAGDQPWNGVCYVVLARVQSIKYNVSDTARLMYECDEQSIANIMNYYAVNTTHTCLMVTWPFISINDFGKPKVMVNESAMTTMILLVVFGLIASLTIASYIIVTHISNYYTNRSDEHKDDDDNDIELMQEDLD